MLFDSSKPLTAHYNAKPLWLEALLYFTITETIEELDKALLLMESDKVQV